MTSADDAPGWLTEGAVVRHTTFGHGVVSGLGEYRGLPAAWIDFDYGERKGLALEYALPHLDPHKRRHRRTPRRADMRCGICGAVPVVLNVDGAKLCEAHTSSCKPDPSAHRHVSAPDSGRFVRFKVRRLSAFT